MNKEGQSEKLTIVIKLNFEGNEPSSVGMITEGVLSNGESFFASSYRYPDHCKDKGFIEVAQNPEYKAVLEQHREAFKKIADEFFNNECPLIKR